MIQLSSRDRILLHLLEKRKEHFQDSSSEALTQSGISSALQIQRTHITRHLRPLIVAGLIEERKMRIQGRERKMKVYFLTPAGLEKAQELINRLALERITVIDDHGKEVMSVSEVLKKFHDISIMTIAEYLHTGIEIRRKDKRIIWSNTNVEIPAFCGRKEELAIASSFFGSDAVALVIFASFGYGSSTLLKKIALERTEMPLLWYDLEMNSDATDIKEAISQFAIEIGCNSGKLEDLRERKILLCFDNYCNVSEDVVDFFFELLEVLKGGKAKVAIAMGEGTPSYNRFFQKEDVERGHVVEIHLQRMDERSAKQLLSLDVDEEAFQLIYQLTRGQPLALELVRKGDAEKLMAFKPKEEVRFLMYLRTKKTIRNGEIRN